MLCLAAHLLITVLASVCNVAAAAPQSHNLESALRSERNRRLPHALDDGNLFRQKGKSGPPTVSGKKSKSSSKNASKGLKGKGPRNDDSPAHSPSAHALMDQAMQSDEEGPTPDPIKPMTVDELLDDVFGRQATNAGCQLNANGLYGDAEAVGDVYTVQYLYQTSVVAGTSITQLNSIVIPALDKAIATSILPRFFDCSGGSNRRRHLQEGTMNAISSMPVDTFILSGCKFIKHEGKYHGFCYWLCRVGLLMRMFLSCLCTQ